MVSDPPGQQELRVHGHRRLILKEHFGPALVY